VRDWLEQLVGQDYLRKSGEYSVLTVTEKGWRVLRGQEAPRLLKPAKRRPEPARAMRDSWEGVDRDLFEALRAVRRRIAAEKSLPPYLVFSDASLRDMARRRPSSPASFLRVHGVGQMKCQQYAEVFLPTLREHCGGRSLAMDVEPPPGPTDTMPPAEASPRTAKGSLILQRAFSLFAEGRSVEEAAQLLDRAPSTALQYLVEYVQDRHLESPCPWVDGTTFDRVAEAVRRVGGERLKPVFEALGGSVPYDRIRVCVACLHNRGKKEG
jgi:ATP-dependent DNA helicase RecQ